MCSGEPALTAHTGEIAGLLTAVCWTASALANESAARRMGVLSLNVLRLALGSLMLAAVAALLRGRALPLDVPAHAWPWLLLSGALGLVFGDFCLFRAFVLIGARRSMLVATVTPALAALIAWPLLGERLSARDLAGMALTGAGVASVVVGRTRSESTHALPLWPGVPLALAGALGQAAGLVLAKIGMGVRVAASGTTGQAIAAAAHTEELLPGAVGAAHPAAPWLPSVDPIAGTQVRLVAGLVGFAVLITLTRRWRPFAAAAAEPRGLGIAAVAALFGPCLGITLSLYAVAHAQAGVAASLMSLSPVLLVPVALFRGDRVGLAGVIGPLLAVAGVTLLTG